MQPVAYHRATSEGAALRDQPQCRHDLAGRTVAALQGVVLDEGLLKRMERPVRGHAFDGGDAPAVLHRRQHEAGIGAPAIDQHGAGAAGAEVAAFLGAVKLQPLAQHVEQGGGSRHRQAMPGAIDLERHVGLMLKEVRHRPPRIVVDKINIGTAT